MSLKHSIEDICKDPVYFFYVREDPHLEEKLLEICNENNNNLQTEKS